MKMAVKSMEMALESTESMEMALRQFPVPAVCRNRDFYPPKLVSYGGGVAELFL
jgi:hypothetical protein